MKLKSENILIILGLVIPALLIFRAYFSASPLVWGDAPFFYNENLNLLFQKPLAWDFRNNNFGSSQLAILWLYLPTFLFGLLHKFFGLDSTSLIRLIFYIPATILSLTGAFAFIKIYTKNLCAQFFGVLLYTFNTYFLLVIDGGQIGVALAYGLFPWVLVSLQNFIDQANIKKFFLSVIVLFLITNVDLRLALLALLTSLVLNLPKTYWFRRVLSRVLSVVLTTFLFDAFWLMPLIYSLQGSFYSRLSLAQPNVVAILNSLLLFNPQFPQNEFGRINPPPFYFGLLPFLVFGFLFFKKREKYYGLVLTALLLVFISKGSNEPLGQIFDFVINRLPFGVAFRDSSKFFVPLNLIYGVLLAITVEKLHFKNIKLRFLSFLTIYVYLILLVWPAVFGQLTGTLALSQPDPSYSVIYQYLKADPIFFRTVWFPERPPMAFSTINKEALSANTLYQDEPFAAQIIGSYDSFNFLHSQQLSDWFKLLGIKYAFFPDDPRKKTYSSKELVERKGFLNFVDNLGFKKLDWPINFAGYQVSNPMPKIFGQQKAIMVMGDASVYAKLAKVPGFSLANQSLLFPEDGFFYPERLTSLPNDSLVVIVDNRGQTDLTMSLLSKYFSNQVAYSQWGQFTPGQYLDSKYELLKNGTLSQDLLFNKGFYFSSVKGEKIQFSIPSQQQSFRLAIRSISASDSAGLKISSQIVKNKSFRWDIIGPFKASSISQVLTLENLGGFQAVNTLAIIPDEQFQVASNKANDFLASHQVINIRDLEKVASVLSDLKSIPVNFKEVDTTDYQVKITDPKIHWVVFSDHFDSGWKLSGGLSYPVYSMINGFYIAGSDNFELYYQPQIIVDLGLKVSIVSGVIFSLIVLVTLVKLR